MKFDWDEYCRKNKCEPLQEGDSPWSPYHFYAANPYVSSKNNPGKTYYGYPENKKKMPPIKRSRRSHKKKTVAEVTFAEPRSDPVFLTDVEAEPVRQSLPSQPAHFQFTKNNNNTNTNSEMSYRSTVSRLFRKNKKYNKKRGKRTRRTLRKRSKGGRYKNRRIRRTSRAAVSLGAASVIGGLGEEDYKVKRHSRFGIVLERGTKSELQGEHAGFIVQTTGPEIEIVKACIMAMIKRLFNHAGYTFKSFSELIPSFNGATTVSVYLEYSYDSPGGALSGYWAEVTPAIQTYMNLVDRLLFTSGVVSKGIINGNTGDVSEAVNKFTRFYLLNGNHTSNNEIATMDAGQIKFNIDLVSALVLQNRTKGEGSTSNALDISQVPLFQVNGVGKGNTPLFSDDNNFMTGLIADEQNGINSEDCGSSGPYVAEPTRGTFINCKKMWSEALEPGVVKQSKIKSSYKNLSLHKLFLMLNTLGRAQGSTNVKTLFGHWKMMWFRKAIDFGLGETDLYRIVFQHHWSAGVTCTYKRFTKTMPYLDQIY